jgi:hypothetical protein
MTRILNVIVGPGAVDVVVVVSMGTVVDVDSVTKVIGTVVVRVSVAPTTTVDVTVLVLEGTTTVLTIERLVVVEVVVAVALTTCVEVGCVLT